MFAYECLRLCWEEGCTADATTQTTDSTLLKHEHALRSRGMKPDDAACEEDVYLYTMIRRRGRV